jgi:hypothetical protein
MIPIPRMQLRLPVDDSPSASSYKKELGNKEHNFNEKHQRKAPVGLSLLKKSIDRLPKSRGNATLLPLATISAYEKPADSRRKVTFARTAKVKKVRSRQHYTADERDGMWHTVDEYVAIKKRALATLKLMVHNPGFEENDEHTDRGLECRTKEASQKRKEFKAYARELVLEEQENHKEAGVKSPGRLRNVYLELSTTAILRAREYGKTDHKAVKHESLDAILAQVKLEYGWR